MRDARSAWGVRWRADPCSTAAARRATPIERCAPAELHPKWKNHAARARDFTTSDPSLTLPVPTHRPSPPQARALSRWVNTMPGRRCLLCADVDDLLDGEVLLELTRVLLSDAVPSPSDAGDAYDDTARVELALEALAGRGGLDLGGFKSDADVLVAVSGAAARWVAGDCRVIAPILAFLKDALAARAVAEDPTLRTPRATRRSSPSATSTRALEALGRVGDRNTESTNPTRESSPRRRASRRRFRRHPRRRRRPRRLRLLARATTRPRATAFPLSRG